jgi:phosphotransferase system HPr-like phosphotransfer protein
MKTQRGIEINLNSIESVKKFVNLAGKCKGDVDIVTSDSRYVVDGKSIMGIFSLDLSKTVYMICRDDEDEAMMICSLGNNILK